MCTFLIIQLNVRTDTYVYTYQDLIPIVTNLFKTPKYYRNTNLEP